MVEEVGAAILAEGVNEARLELFVVALIEVEDLLDAVMVPITLCGKGILSVATESIC